MSNPVATLLHRHAGFVRDVATLLSGQGGAMAISLLAMPVIARLYTADDFGVVSLLVAIVQPLVIVGTLQLGTALVLPAQDRDAWRVRAAAFTWLSVVVALVAAIALAVMTSGWPAFAGTRAGAWLWVVPVGVALLGSVQLLIGGHVRARRYAAIARGHLVTAAGNAGTRIALGFAWGSSVAGLVAGFLVGVSAQAAYLARVTPTVPGAGRLLAAPATTRKVLSEYRDFPLYNAPSGLIGALTQSLPLILLGIMFTPATVGFYAMATRLVGAPGNLVANAVRRVTLQRGAALHNRGESLRRALLKVLAMLALGGLAPLALLWSFGEEFLTWLLGANWSRAGRYAELLAPLLYVQWLAAPMRATLVVIRRQDLWLRALILDVLARLGVFGVAFAAGYDDLWVIGALVVVAIVVRSVMLVVTLMLADETGTHKDAASQQPVTFRDSSGAPVNTELD